MAAEVAAATAVGTPASGAVSDDIGESSSEEQPLLGSLHIPITSGSSTSSGDKKFIEIFPEELPETPSSTLLQVLKDEESPLSVWADAALLYMQVQQARDSSVLLQAACDRPGGSPQDRVRLLASAGIAHLTQDATEQADAKFTHSAKVDNLFPMTWMGRGMWNLRANRLDQARFFLDTTLKECGKVLPALLGLAVVQFREKDYKGAQDLYGQAIRLYPQQSGAATRVGFAMACFKLGQVDRAKAAFARALEMDPENVDAMVATAVLNMTSLDESSPHYVAVMEKAIKMMSMANLLDHSNAMVQNHLANHYFWKWTPLSGTVQMTRGSKLVQGSQAIPLDPGEKIRIGTDFETYVEEDANNEDDNDVDGKNFTMRDSWPEDSATGLKVWKKDYDRVIALAKGAYNSTSVQEIQAESLFHLARVYHVRDDLDHAHQFYERACKLSPDLTPARFGLAQTLIAQEKYDQAAAHLQLVLGTAPMATDALATLGLLQVRANKVAEGLTSLRKAIDLEPLNPDLLLCEALALQQHERNFPKALAGYRKAVNLMERQGKKIPLDLYTNIGVLCHQTKQYDEALKMYNQALDNMDKSPETKLATLDNVGKEGAYIRHKDNAMFFGYVDSLLQVEYEAGGEGTAVVRVLDSSSQELADLVVKAGDHIRVGEDLESVVMDMKKGAEGITLMLHDAIGGKKKVGSTDGEDTEMKDADDETEKKTETLFVKRENRRLDNTSAISIAFNVARLHETVGRTLAAVELHKALLKRNPSYMNSYLRLACIAIDCGALKECAGWLKTAAETAPGNPEVLTLIGNLHLSLCDWAPAQQVFDGLVGKKIPQVTAYAMLSLGNIYFETLHTPTRYAKHIQYAADYYKRIILLDNTNAYAANGLGTILAEKAALFKAKEVFNRVREVTGDSIAGAHLNLGHIYLAQKRHPEALQMYQSYLKRTEDGTAPITSKSRTDDKVEVLLYIAFAYFDWARQTELFNNTKAAPADERYKKAMEHLELALQENTSKKVVLTHNLCMTKLQAANCVLQKLTRNIRRTAAEVEDALVGLEQSVETVEEIQKQKAAGMKVPIASSMLNDFLVHSRSNVESAKSHLEDERKREDEARELKELQRLASESQRKQNELTEQLKKEEQAKQQEERDRRAREKMKKVEDLQAGWNMEKIAAAKSAAERKAKKNKPAPDAEDDGLFPEEEQAPAPSNLFDDSDDDDNDETEGAKPDDADKETSGEDKVDEKPEDKPTEQELFGDSSDEESDEELVPSSNKRSAEDEGDAVGEEEHLAKKQKVLDDEEGSD